VSQTYKEGGHEAVLALFPRAAMTERKDLGFVHYSISGGRNANESVTLNKKGEIVYGSA
jgi:hypothetical protein